jgi:L-asparagine oxygenase
MCMELVTCHPVVPVARNVPAEAWATWLTECPPLAPTDPTFVRAAGHATRLLPDEIHRALIDFADLGDPSGALLLRDVPTGSLPPTPLERGPIHKADSTSEFALLTIARSLGQPVGYLPEHGGAIIQNLFPVEATATQQVSTSSSVDLFFHTETAFHPHRPRYLLLLCLRSDPNARTTLCSIDAVLDDFTTAELDVLRSPRFRTGVDASFGGSAKDHGDTIAVLSGTREQPTMVFDADLMIGVDHEAERILQKLSARISARATAAILEPGDLLVIDNNRAVHGRSPFQARFDGTDRWLQRTFVVNDLAASASERTGRIITTRWDCTD